MKFKLLINPTQEWWYFQEMFAKQVPSLEPTTRKFYYEVESLIGDFSWYIVVPSH